MEQKYKEIAEIGWMFSWGETAPLEKSNTAERPALMIAQSKLTVHQFAPEHPV